MYRKTYGLLAALVALAFMAVPVTAQVEVSIGAKGGLSLADIDIEDAEDQDDVDYRSGFTGGIFFDIGTDAFGVQPGIFYTQKGAEVNDVDADIELQLDYLQIPVLARLSVPSDGAFGFHFLAGPVVSFEMTCKIAGEGQGVSIDVDCDQFGQGFGPGGVDTKSTDFGVIFGGGLEYRTMSGAKIFVDGLYNLGLTNIEDTPGADGEVKNRAILIEAGVSVPLGR